MSRYLELAQRELQRIHEQDRYRDLPVERTRFTADFSTNDYLGLATDSRMVEVMRHVKRVGSGGARLLGGAHPEHAFLEEDLARWLARERALLFSSGYLAALGAIAVLARLTRVIYSDARNHASLIDGIRAAALPRTIYQHNQLPPLDERIPSALIVTESLFSMDGDLADIASIVAQLGEDDVLLVDEAHALGVLGRQGGGLAHGLNDERIIVLGTLSKAIGAAGGFIAGPDKVIDLLINTARTFIFDTAMPPAIAFAARVGVTLARNADDARGRLRSKIARTRYGLEGLGVPQMPLDSPIVPVPAGDESRALLMMDRAIERGVYAPAIRPPTVPEGSSCLRVSVRANHADEEIDRLIEALTCTAIS